MQPLHPRTLFALTLTVSTGLVGGGLYLAMALNLAACPLCIIQRMLYLLLAVTALIGFSLPNSRIGQLIASLIGLDIAVLGIFVAGYQVWLQRFAKDVSCTANAPWWEELVYWAGEKIPLLFQANGLCSDPGWKFLGLSIADGSTLAFSGLAVLMLIVLLKLLRQR